MRGKVHIEDASAEELSERAARAGK